MNKIKLFQNTRNLKAKNFYWILQIFETGQITLTEHRLLYKGTKSEAYIYGEGKISKKLKVAHFENEFFTGLEMYLVLQDGKFTNSACDDAEAYIFETRENAVQYLNNIL